MRSRSILPTGASLLVAFALTLAVGAAPVQARGLIAPAKVCPNETGLKDRAKARKSMICLTNYARKKSGLKRYRVKSRLTGSANYKAGDIIGCDSFSHSACGREFVYWIKVSGYTDDVAWSAGENIAWGSGSYGSSRSIFRAWMKSPGHRRAILSRVYRDLGIGLKVGTLNDVPKARVWVQHFGRRG
ncbi:MAG: CAP domain-containing protein [Solirubrobacterales bacterium]